MSPLPQMHQVQARCTNVLDTKTAFLTRIDNGESIFVPSTVAFVSGLAPGDVVTAHIVPNTHQPGKLQLLDNFAEGRCGSSPQRANQITKRFQALRRRGARHF